MLVKLTAARLADGPAQGKAIAVLEDQDRGTALAAEARIVAPTARGSMFVVLFPGAAVGLVGRLVEQNGRRNDGHVAWVAVAHDLGVKRRIAVGRKEPLNDPHAFPTADLVETVANLNAVRRPRGIIVV